MQKGRHKGCDSCNSDGQLRRFLRKPPHDIQLRAVGEVFAGSRVSDAARAARQPAAPISARFTAIIRAPYNVRVIVPALCVVCRQRPIEEAWRPFCSERCKLQDLARWLDGVYCVPGDPASTDDRVSEPNHSGPTHDE